MEHGVLLFSCICLLQFVFSIYEDSCQDLFFLALMRDRWVKLKLAIHA